MPIGPKGVFECVGGDLEVVDKIVTYIDRALHCRMSDWDGESPIKVSFLLSDISFPKLAIRVRVQKEYTEGEDCWSSIEFLEGRIWGWTVILTP